MAEALAVVAAVSSFVQLVDFSAKAGKAAHELVASNQNVLVENVQIERLTTEYQVLAAKCLQAELPGLLPEYQPQHVRIARYFQDEALALLSDLEALKVDSGARGLRRFVQGLYKALKSIANAKTTERRRQHLRDLNCALTTAILVDLQRHSLGISMGRYHFLADPGGGRYLQRSELARNDLSEGLVFPRMSASMVTYMVVHDTSSAWSFRPASKELQNWLKTENESYCSIGRAWSGISISTRYSISTQ